VQNTSRYRITCDKKDNVPLQAAVVIAYIGNASATHNTITAQLQQTIMNWPATKTTQMSAASRCLAEPQQQQVSKAISNIKHCTSHYRHSQRTSQKMVCILQWQAATFSLIYLAEAVHPTGCNFLPFICLTHSSLRSRTQHPAALQQPGESQQLLNSMTLTRMQRRNATQQQHAPALCKKAQGHLVNST
jgi:hypothetical protein